MRSLTYLEERRGHPGRRASWDDEILVIRVRVAYRSAETLTLNKNIIRISMYLSTAIRGKVAP